MLQHLDMVHGLRWAYIITVIANKLFTTSDDGVLTVLDAQIYSIIFNR